MDITRDVVLPLDVLAAAWYAQTSEPYTFSRQGILSGFMLATAHLWSSDELFGNRLFENAILRLFRLQAAEDVCAVLNRVSAILHTRRRQDLRHPFSYLCKLIDVIACQLLEGNR